MIGILIVAAVGIIGFLLTAGIAFDSRELSNRLTLFIDNASFEKERLLHCVIAMRRVTRYTVYSVRGKE